MNLSVSMINKRLLVVIFEETVLISTILGVKMAQTGKIETYECLTFQTWGCFYIAPTPIPKQVTSLFFLSGNREHSIFSNIPTVII